VTALDARVRARAGALELDLDLHVDERGLALVGPNGAGKTTTLLALLGVRRSEGPIHVGGHALHDLPPEERGLAYLPQHYALFPHLTAAGNVAFALRGRDRTARARAVLERLDAGHLADRLPAALSGGERQRVALARALAVSPRALLLDEPFAALDVEARDEVRAFLAAELRALARPFIVVTHDRADLEALGAPLCVLEGGRAVQRGALAELEAAPANRFVARLVTP
jgi:molybdate transport system ATP-binding protein